MAGDRLHGGIDYDDVHTRYSVLAALSINILYLWRVCTGGIPGSSVLYDAGMDLPSPALRSAMHGVLRFEDQVMGAL